MIGTITSLLRNFEDEEGKIPWWQKDVNIDLSVMQDSSGELWWQNKGNGDAAIQVVSAVRAEEAASVAQMHNHVGTHAASNMYHVELANTLVDAVRTEHDNILDFRQFGTYGYIPLYETLEQAKRAMRAHYHPQCIDSSTLYTISIGNDSNAYIKTDKSDKKKKKLFIPLFLPSTGGTVHGHLPVEAETHLARRYENNYRRECCWPDSWNWDVNWKTINVRAQAQGAADSAFRG